MKNAKKIAHIGAGIQILGIILIWTLVLRGQPVPGYVAGMFGIGLALTLLGSLIFVRREGVTATDKRKVIALILILFFWQVS